jgi:Large polyvalent protein associated domain 29
MSWIGSDGTEHLTCAETAKLVRRALKEKFSGTKFSVRSKTYAGGASIDVSYTDGPTTREVDAVIQKFAGAGFDGMIDLKYHKDHWLMPDGTVQIAHSSGTEGSRGSVPSVLTDPPSPNARLVSFGADYVFSHRSVSDEWRNEVLDEFERVLDRNLPREEREMWRVTVPLKVDRLNGDLHHMVETEQESLTTVLTAYTAVRNRTGNRAVVA